MSKNTFTLDGEEVPFEEGQSIMQAALAAGHYIPYLCSNKEFKAHGSCKVCTVKLNGRMATSCTTPASSGDLVESKTEEVLELRKNLVQFLFTEGNHFCPSCEQSGRCVLQAVGYELGMDSGHYNPLFPTRPVDASHPDVLLDYNRCILCEMCVRASAEVDGKNVFSLAGRGLKKRLVVNSESGRLGDTSLAVGDKAMEVCPVGVIIRKRRGFDVPIGKRKYDQKPVSKVSVRPPNGQQEQG